MLRFPPIERAIALAALAILAGCATVSATDRAWIETDGEANVVPLGCPPREMVTSKVGNLPSDRSGWR